MAYEYALVHVKYTIPLAAVLTLLGYPLFNRVHLYEVLALVIVAFTATLPWDAYLISHNVWTYPPDAILGPKLLGIPVEELFFFIIQTYITSLIYIICNKPLLHAQYLKTQRNPPAWVPMTKLAGQAILLGLSLYGSHLVRLGGEVTYLGLILVWAFPFALITWTMAGRFIISLPWTATVLPILVPTVYLWLVDELALGRGTWSIETGTKLGYCLFGFLEIEEATFFLATNMLIVFGLATFDQYLAIIYAFPRIFPEVPKGPSPLLLLEGRMVSSSKFDMERVNGICEAVERLKKKSRSFYLASAAFTGRLRIDLVLLYSFCRMADDLVDNQHTSADAAVWVNKLKRYLDFHYKKADSKMTMSAELKQFIADEFPPSAKTALSLLPADSLPSEPLYSLVDGFEMDSHFNDADINSRFPIKDEADLELYGARVAGTVGEMCFALIAHHCADDDDMITHKLELANAARRMGIALQYINISRDISVDAKMGRVYLPTTWLKEAGLTPLDVVKQPEGQVIEGFRRRLLSMAFDIYEESRPPMRWLPDEARGPMIVAVENYMEIGRVLREKQAWTVQQGKATVPIGRRLRVALRALLTA